MFVVVTTKGNDVAANISPVYLTRYEANKSLELIYNEVYKRLTLEFGVEDEGSVTRNEKGFYIKTINDAYGGWIRSEIVELKEDAKNIKPIPADTPQSVIFEGSSAEDVQEQANAFFKHNPNAEVIDAELSATLETTSVAHYFRVIYAIIYKTKEEN